MHGLAFSADGKKLATGGKDGRLVVTSLSDTKHLHSFPKQRTWPYWVQFAADGETVAAVYERDEPVVRVWSLKDGDFITLATPGEEIHRVSLRADGRLAVTTSHQGSVRVWDLSTAQPQSVALARGSVLSKNTVGTMSRDGRHFAAANLNGTVQVFRLPDPAEDVGKWIAARAGPRGLSEREWLVRVQKLHAGNVGSAIESRVREVNPGLGNVRTVTDDGVVTELHVDGNVRDISAVRAAPNLRFFGAAHAPLADLSPLKGQKLTRLTAFNTGVADLSPLQGMPLETLDCTHSRGIFDLKPLAGMRLTWFSCDGARVSDLTPLKGMPLKHLNCVWTRITDLTPLTGMELNDLFFSGTDVSDLTPLTGMNLGRLFCAETKVSDLAPLRGMKLHDLRCISSKVGDANLKDLREMSTLRHLEIGGPGITDAGVVHLKDLTNLEVFMVFGGKVTGAGFEQLKKLTKLVHLRVDKNPIADAHLQHLQHLQHLAGLRELILEQTPVTDAGLDHVAAVKTLVYVITPGRRRGASAA